MKILHIVPGLDDPACGIAAAVKRIAQRQRAANEVALVASDRLTQSQIEAADEVWVHGMWTPDKWGACLRTRRAGKILVRMLHGSLSPISLQRQGKWKKRLVRPLERLCFAWADRVVATGAWEVAWARAWGVRCSPEVVDLLQFFDLDVTKVQGKAVELARRTGDVSLRVLYLGRRHPLKGVEYLTRAVEELNGRVELRVVSDHFGAALERDWDWCDVLCLPTLSENFGLVVAEALERGKPVVTTDGAPAWWEYFAQHPEAGVFLTGFRDGDATTRVRLLRDAFAQFSGGAR